MKRFSENLASQVAHNLKLPSYENYDTWRAKFTPEFVEQMRRQREHLQHAALEWKEMETRAEVGSADAEKTPWAAEKFK